MNGKSIKCGVYRTLVVACCFCFFFSCSAEKETKEALLKEYAHDENIVNYLKTVDYEKLKNVQIYDVDFYSSEERKTLDIYFFGTSRKVIISITQQGKEILKGAPVVAEKKGEGRVFLGCAGLEFGDGVPAPTQTFTLSIKTESGHSDSRKIEVFSLKDEQGRGYYSSSKE